VPKKEDQAPVISIRGARQHNLKNLDLDIPIGELTVITGPSGSGKSSLAFHTLYAEGQRRYVETFSPYVRQFFDRMDKPEVDKIEGIPPAIAIEQKNTIRTTRSTVGTLTEINDYLKLLYQNSSTRDSPLATTLAPEKSSVPIPQPPSSVGFRKISRKKASLFSSPSSFQRTPHPKTSFHSSIPKVTSAFFSTVRFSALTRLQIFKSSPPRSTSFRIASRSHRETNPVSPSPLNKPSPSEKERPLSVKYLNSRQTPSSTSPLPGPHFAPQLPLSSASIHLSELARTAVDSDA